MRRKAAVSGWMPLSFFLAIAAAPAPVGARSIMVVGPHEDDEALLGAGRIRAAVLAGDTVTVVLATNGDSNGTDAGLMREGESVAAARLLGVPEQSVVFLGYGDQTLINIWANPSGAQVITSSAGQTATYASRGLGGVDFHRFLTGVPGSYNRDTVAADFRALITYFRPDEIYTVSRVDGHGDHQAVARFLNEALIALKREGADVRSSLLETVVWAPFANGGCWVDSWPGAGSGPLPYPPFIAPQCIGPGTSLDWERILRFPVPPEMQTSDPESNLKWRTLQAYSSQFGGFLTNFVRKDEFFWRYDFGTNLSAVAQVSASSEFVAGGGSRGNVVDGYADLEHEWKSDEGAGAWVQLDWTSPVRIAEVSLFDRVSASDNVLSGTLSFSDGSSLAVGALPVIGKPLTLTFPPRIATWVRFTLDQVTGTTPGLAELEVRGVPASFGGNVPPHFIRGPLPSASAIDSTQTAALTVQAHDLDGDPLQYTWTADGGSIAGDGATAVFTPPAVNQQTVFTITVQISDGRGGVTSNSAFVTVSNAPAWALELSPSSVVAGVAARGTVLLSEAAPAGGAAVQLSSGAPAVASAPAFVTIPAGSKSATFDIATSTVATPTAASITASFGGQDRTATLTVLPPGLSSLSLSPIEAVGGSVVQATANLTAPAPASGVVLQLGSSDATVATVPATAVVAGGAQSAVFSVSTAEVSSTRTVTLSAADGSSTATAVLTLGPLQVAGLALSPASVVGGASAQGTVALNGLAPATGAIVLLTSSAPSAAMAPASVWVPAGASSATFTVTTAPVGTATSALLTAALGGSSQSASLAIQSISLASIALSSTSVLGGGAATGTVSLSGAAPSGGVAVALESSNPAVVSVASSVTVPEGSASASFPIATSPVAVAMSATVGATLAGVARSARLSVMALTVSSVSLSPANVVGGSPSTGTVTLSAAAPGAGVVVALSSVNPAVAAVSPTVTVAGGATSATFPVATAPVAERAIVSIEARYGTATQATLTIRAPALSSLEISPASVVGGTSSSGVISLTGPAPQGGFPVFVASSNPFVASAPASVAVPAGSTSATFTVATHRATSLARVSLSATAGSVSRSATLTVTARVAIRGLTLEPSSIRSLETSVATVQLNAPAPPGGTVVKLSSSNRLVASVPGTLVVPEGALSATAAVTAHSALLFRTSSISATAGGATESAMLTVAP